MLVAKRWTLLMLLISFLISTESEAQKFKNPFKRKPKNNSSSSDLTAKNGPWLIMCTSFSGEDAEYNARLLANYLTRHRLTTYIYRQTFDYSGSMTGVGYQPPRSVDKLVADGEILTRPADEGRPELRKMRIAKEGAVQEVAVLVGDFPTIDDNGAQKTLAIIKNLKIENLGAEDPANQASNGASGGFRGQLRTAMLVPNPMLPEEYFRQNQLDDYIIKANKKIEFSLLKCPGIYSVRIASFRGKSIIDPKEIEKDRSEFEALQRSGKFLTSSRLLDAENNAHKITAALRARGVEAYEFHDRTESIVCIGSFDYVTKKSQGVEINNPDIVRIVNKLRPEVKNLPGLQGAIIPKSIMGVPLDPAPTPILVPKVESNRTAGRLSFRRR